MKTMNDVQTQVQKKIDELVDSGAERGLQVAAYKGGDLVVDAVAGVADPATGRKVDSGTPFYCYSVVKGAASTITHILVERGLFGYDTPVVEVWPEFGAHGKEKVTVRHVLSHTAGVPGIPLTTTIEDLCDWDKMCAAIADQELWWEPGTKIGYHAYTFGYIVGEIIRRTTGKPISKVLVEEVSVPLGVDKELYFGTSSLRTGHVVRAEMKRPKQKDLELRVVRTVEGLPLGYLSGGKLLLAAADGGKNRLSSAFRLESGGKSTAREVSAALLDLALDPAAPTGYRAAAPTETSHGWRK